MSAEIPSGGRGLLTPLVLLGVATLLAPSGSLAATKEYAYLLVQGSISDPSDGGPLDGATVRLSSGGRVFEARTDDRGVFTFEKLPIARYEIQVTNAEGQNIRNIRHMEPGLPRVERFNVEFGRGPGIAALLDARKEGVSIAAPKAPIRWRRFWIEFAIFAGSAGLLAL